MVKVKCIKNASTSLPFVVGEIYDAEVLAGLAYKIHGTSGHIIAPLEGHYLTFEIV